MPAKTTATPPNKDTDTNAFIQDYLADWDDNDDPFRSPSPEPGAGAKKNDKKRKEPDTLGIDEQIDLTKKARVPRVKLDETRLLSEKGIPALRKRAPKLKLKGKGHEFSDAARLLSFYQEWLDDLFPKATFLDALAMVEKTGHKTIIRNERLKCIEEGKPKTAATADDDDPFGEEPVPRQANRIAPIFENSNSAARQGTPPNPDDDLFGDDDIYNATPRRDRLPQTSLGADVPGDDDLDALMAEAEASGTTREKGTTKTTMPVFGSIFGGGGITSARPVPPQPSGELDDDDLDALMAEAEGLSTSAPPGGGHVSIFGGGKPKEAIPIEEDDDLDALMAEAEARIAPPAKETGSVKESPTGSSHIAGNEKGKDAEKSIGQDDEENELNALMTEAEGPAPSASNAAAAFNPNNEQQKGKDFEDEEEAMAEMDGLW